MPLMPERVQMFVLCVGLPVWRDELQVFIVLPGWVLLELPGIDLSPMRLGVWDLSGSEGQLFVVLDWVLLRQLDREMFAAMFSWYLLLESREEMYELPMALQNVSVLFILPVLLWQKLNLAQWNKFISKQCAPSVDIVLESLHIRVPIGIFWDIGAQWYCYLCSMHFSLLIMREGCLVLQEMQTAFIDPRKWCFDQ